MDIVDMAQKHIQGETLALLSRLNNKRPLPLKDWKLGPSICEECGDIIPERRRQAVPGTRYCRECAEELGI
jgi:phage/conjugal plasmid C-4 type zinc finger TraR family protein